MNKNLVLFSVIFFMCYGIYAQSTATISGQLIDEKTKESIPFASIVILPFSPL